MVGRGGVREARPALEGYLAEGRRRPGDLVGRGATSHIDTVPGWRRAAEGVDEVGCRHFATPRVPDLHAVLEGREVTVGPGLVTDTDQETRSVATVGGDLVHRLEAVVIECNDAEVGATGDGYGRCASRVWLIVDLQRTESDVRDDDVGYVLWRSPRWTVTELRELDEGVALTRADRAADGHTDLVVAANTRDLEGVKGLIA